MSDRPRIVGDWRLTTWRTETPAGDVLDHPFGTDAIGLLSITPSVLQVQMMRAGRPAFAVPMRTAADRRGRDPQELADAFASSMSYAGPYRLEAPDLLVTTVAVALVPDFAGTEQVRRIDVDGDRLRLRSLPRTVDGVEQIGVLLWSAYGVGR